MLVWETGINIEPGKIRAIRSPLLIDWIALGITTGFAGFSRYAISLDMTYLTWYKIAEHINELDFADNGIAVAEIKGKKICIARFNKEVFAFAYRCPHAGGHLADGRIDVLGNVTCPIHSYKYSLQNGRNTSGEGYYLKNWPVELREDGIYVGMEESTGLFGWLK